MGLTCLTTVKSLNVDKTLPFPFLYTIGSQLTSTEAMQSRVVASSGECMSMHLKEEKEEREMNGPLTSSDWGRGCNDRERRGKKNDNVGRKKGRNVRTTTSEEPNKRGCYWAVPCKKNGSRRGIQYDIWENCATIRGWNIHIIQVRDVIGKTVIS